MKNQEQESYWDRLKAFKEQEGSFDRLKAFKDKKVPLTEKGKATIGAAIGAPILFEGLIHMPGTAGVAVSLAAIGLTALHGEKAFKVGRWLKGKFIEDNEAPSQSEEGSLEGGVVESNTQHPRQDAGGNNEISLERGNVRKSFEQYSMQGIARDNASFSKYPENETLRLGLDVKKKQRLDPWINDLFGKGMIVAAVQGSGKSMLCGLIIEQAAKCGVPAIVFDHKGEYSGIVDLPFVHGLRVGSDRLRAKINCFELSADEANADDFVHLVMQERLQAIVHLPSYGDGWLDRAKIVAAVGKALMRYSANQSECGNPIIPCLVFQDEAQLYIPQDPRMLPPEARKNSDVLDTLNNAYFALVTNGRSNGYTMCFATPSLTYVAKSMIKSCQIRVLMRHAEKNDLDMCEQIVNNAVTREEIESMPVGTGIVFGFTPKPVVVKFDTRQSRDLSETPGIERLRQPISRDINAEDWQLQHGGTTILPETMEDIMPKRLGATHRTSTRLNPILEKALNFYNEGCNSSRTLAVAMGVGKDTANGYIRQLKERRLVV